MQETKKRLFENIVSQGALQIINYIIPLITLPYQVRVVGAEKFGLIAFATATIMYFSLVVDYGFTWSATKEISQNRHNTNNISNIFNSVICIKLILSVICFLILLFLLSIVPKLHQDWLIFIITYIMVLGNVIYPNWFFVGQERVKYITCLSIFAKTLFMMALFVFVKQQSDYLLIPLFNTLGNLIAGCVGFVYAVKKFNLKLYIPHFTSLKIQFKESTQFFFANVAVTFFTNTNTFCLGLIGSNLSVGYYVAAEKIYNAIIGIRFPLEVAIYPYMAKNKDITLFKKISFLAVTVNMIICIGLFIFAKPLIILFYGNEIIIAYKILQIFCIAAIFEFPSVIIGYIPLIVFNHKRTATSSIFIASFIHILVLLTLYLTNSLNIYTVAILVLFTTIFMFMYRIFFVIKYKLLSESYSSK